MTDENASSQPSTAKKRPRDRERSLSHAPARQKRDKYTSVACNECKKRKIKCSGDVVCRGCESYNIPCEYANLDSDTAGQTIKNTFAKMESEISTLQQQVNGLLVAMKQMQSQYPPPVSVPDENALFAGTPKSASNLSNSKPPSKTKNPQFPGPTSSAFSFNVANSTLHSMGLQADLQNNDPPIDSTLPTRLNTPEPVTSHMSFSDPLLSISVSEILRLLQVYKEEIGVIYPFIHVENIVAQVEHIYDGLQVPNNMRNPGNGNQVVAETDNKNTRLLKMIVATALVVEGLGRSTLGQQLVESVEFAIGRSARDVIVDFTELQILTISSVFYFHCDEEVLAWRTIGFAARMAMEMGLHRKESLVQSFTNSERPIRLFWCIYVLDRRWSFGTGMPFALQDSDIDPELPTPGSSVPYLEILTAYGKICSKVWQAIAGFDNSGKDVDKESMAYLDFKIQQWIQSIPPDLQLYPTHRRNSLEEQSPTIRRLRVLLYIRGNQMRTLIHRQNVISATNIMKNLEGAHLVTDIAKDTIRVLVDLNKTSDIYRKQQTAFNYFLVSALAAIFLAVCHAPAEFSHTCRNEFYDALDLVKNFSARSSVSRRLWKSVRKLKHVAPRLGLVANEEQQPSAMDGAEDLVLIGCCNSPRTIPQTRAAASTTDFGSENFVGPGWLVEGNESAPSVSLPDMSQMSNDLTSLFEAFGNPMPAAARDGEGRLLQTGYDQWLESFLPENGNEVSRLFEGFM